MAVAVVGNAFAPLAALATAPIMARGLGVAGRGDVAAATAPLLLATTVATFGIPAAVNFFVSKRPALVFALARRGIVLTALAGALASAAVLLASDFLSSGDASLARLIALAGLAIAPALAVSVVQSVAAGTGRWGLVTAERLVTASVRLGAFVALLAAQSITIESSVVVLAGSPIAGGLVYLALVRHPVTADDGESRIHLAELLSYGTRVWIGSITGVLLSRLDQTLLLPLGGSHDLGLYVVAVTVGELPLVIVNAVRDVLFSADAADSRDDRLGVASRLSTLVALLVSVAVAVTMPLWLTILFGDEFEAAAPVAGILLAAVVAGNPGSLAGVALSSRGRPGLRSMSLVAACVVNVAALVLLVPVVGAVGAALATLAGNLVAGTACVLLLRRADGVPARTFYGIRREDLRAVRAVLRRW